MVYQLKSFRALRNREPVIPFGAENPFFAFISLVGKLFSSDI